MKEYITGLYGRFVFTIVRRKFKRTFETEFDLVAEITDTDNGNIELTDNDGMIYIVSKKKIKSFEAQIKPEYDICHV